LFFTPRIQRVGTLAIARVTTVQAATMAAAAAAAAATGVYDTLVVQDGD